MTGFGGAGDGKKRAEGLFEEDGVALAGLGEDGGWRPAGAVGDGEFEGDLCARCDGACNLVSERIGEVGTGERPELG